MTVNTGSPHAFRVRRSKRQAHNVAYVFEEIQAGRLRLARAELFFAYLN